MIIRPLPDYAAYWTAIRVKARELNSDGCTFALKIHVKFCYEHDVHWRTGRWVSGKEISFSEADRVFRERIQGQSVFGAFSPMAWWRWAAVRTLGSAMRWWRSL